MVFREITYTLRAIDLWYSKSIFNCISFGNLQGSHAKSRHSYINKWIVRIHIYINVYFLLDYMSIQCAALKLNPFWCRSQFFDLFNHLLQWLPRLTRVLGWAGQGLDTCKLGTFLLYPLALSMPICNKKLHSTRAVESCILKAHQIKLCKFELLPHPVRKSELSTKIHYTDHVVRIWGFLTPSPPYEDTFTK